MDIGVAAVKEFGMATRLRSNVQSVAIARGRRRENCTLSLQLAVPCKVTLQGIPVNDLVLSERSPHITLGVFS